MHALKIGFGLAASCLLIIGWNYHFAFAQFGGNDGGILVNVAWTQYRGMVAYRDFSTVLPALFVYPAGWAFDLGGPTWKSLTCLVCVYSLLTFSWTFALLWMATKRPWSALVFALLLQIIVMFPLSWWWYNQVTGLMLPIYFGSVLFLILEPENRWARISFWLALALSAFCKANTAGLILIFTSVLLLINGRTRIFTLMAILSAGLADLGFLFLNHVGPLLLLQNYLQLGQRITMPVRWLYCLGIYDPYWKQMRLDLLMIGVLLASVGWLFWMAWPFLKRQGLRFSFAWMLGTAVAVLLMGCLTSSDLKPLEAACLIMLIPFLGLSPLPALYRTPTYCILGYFAFTSLCVGWLRERVLSVGRGSFFQPVPLTEMQNPALLRGMRSGPVLRGLVAQVGQILREENFSATSKKVFFGPRMDFLYAAYDVPFQPGLPICWEKIPSSHHGENLPFGIHMAPILTSPSRWISDGQPLDPRVQQFLNVKFDLCIFLKGTLGIPDMTYLPADIRAALYDGYSLQNRGQVAVFTRKSVATRRSETAGM